MVERSTERTPAVQTCPSWSKRSISGYPVMTRHMYIILAHLKLCDEAGWPWQALDEIHGNSKRGLVERDWIVRSPGLDGIKYAITPRGRRALRVYSLPVEPRRYDDICPGCGQRPVLYVHGNRRGYCRPCERKRKARQSRFFKYRSNPDRICPRCKKRKVHVTENGHVGSYCLPCKRQRAKDERRRKKERRFQQIAEGNPPICITCKTRPVYHTRNTVYDYCYSCYRQYQEAWRLRRQKQRAEEKRMVGEEYP